MKKKLDSKEKKSKSKSRSSQKNNSTRRSSATAKNKTEVKNAYDLLNREIDRHTTTLAENRKEETKATDPDISLDIPELYIEEVMN